MNTELRLWMEYHKMCPHCHAAFTTMYGDAAVGYWHFDGYCKKSPEMPAKKISVRAEYSV